MAMEILKEYDFGDICVRYLVDKESRLVSMLLLPGELKGAALPRKNEETESLVQFKLTQDVYEAAYALGNTMRNSESVRRLRYREQNYKKEGAFHTVDTLLEDDRNYRIVHHLVWKEDAPYVRISCTFVNGGEQSCELEMLESFSLGGLSPYLEGDGYGNLYLHRIRSVWSQEGRLESIPVEDLQLEPAWDPHAVRCERFGQTGSMPVNKFFPFAAVEDRKNHVFWGAQIACPASWQMEVYRKDDGLSLSGGLADRDFGHWLKRIEPGESFQTPEAIVSVACTDSLDIFTGRLVKAAEEGLENVPESEKDLPIVFNEYCTTWGDPSHKNICEILNTIKGKGFRYFVIDCGWYRQKGVPWDISMGDYNVSKELFPGGMEQTVKAIKDAGMIPGIWFEIDNVGSASEAYKKEEHLLHKDGKVLTSYFRRFWDMCDPWVEDYLTEKVIGTLNGYGFGYMKIDHNETLGIGCDGAESLGEGLRRNEEASVRFIEKVKEEVPGIVLENCASGGHRLEPSLMEKMSMASFSDAHECREIPVIAANLHRVIHPAQSQIWAVVRKEDSLKRIAYSVANTFLGRMCISGDVTELGKEQWELIEDGMDFYKEIAPIVRDGQSYRYGSKIRSARHPEGWQALVRIGADRAYAVLHTFGGELPGEVAVKLPEGSPEKITRIYADRPVEINVCDGELRFRPEENDMAVAVILSK